MSHSKEREEKICLNCSAELNGRFCHICGQENHEPKESVWGLISHFIHDITHFDGKFFSTVKYLVKKPGFLPKEYIRGRRASYLHPIRMYVFSSAIFFTIFFSLFSAKDMFIEDDKNPRKKDVSENLTRVRQQALKEAKTPEDSLTLETYFSGIKSYITPGDRNDSIRGDSAFMKLKEKQHALKNAKTFHDSIQIEAYYGAMEARRGGNQSFVEPVVRNEENTFFGVARKFTRVEYDSLQKSLPPNRRDGWFKQLATYRTIELNDRYQDDRKELFRDLADKFLHTLPYMLFVSLPLYALFLKLLYIRRRKFYYVDHGIFLIYLYIFTFLVLLVFFSLGELNKAWDSGWIKLLQAALLFYGVFYTVKAMRNFYGQGRGRTILKFLIFNLMSFTSLTILFVLFFILTVLRF